MGWLGCALARAGRAADARRLLSELDERGSRGEFIPPLARLQVNIGLGDVAAIRTTLAAAIELDPGGSARVEYNPWYPPIYLAG